MIKRTFDISLSLFGLLLLFPFFFIVALLLKITSVGPVFYNQKRVGKDFNVFKIHKFRTMIVDADQKGLKITVGDHDPRITSIGRFLRKYKLDELPQLFNVLKGEMSIVGPRPEVEKYVKLYNDKQKRVLSIRPGITDLASIKYRDESEIIRTFDDPETGYIQEIMPKKLTLNLEYIKSQSIFLDIKIIFKTFLSL